MSKTTSSLGKNILEVVDLLAGRKDVAGLKILRKVVTALILRDVIDDGVSLDWESM